jgi:hypothetical protein
MITVAKGKRMYRAVVVLSLCLADVLAAQVRLRPSDPRPKSGKVVVDIDFAKTPTTVESLISDSELIVDASVIDVLPSRRPNQTWILTDSLISVTNVLAGTLQGGIRTIAVSQFGGKINDLEVVFPPDVPMKVGERYIFFLRRDTSTPQDVTNYSRYYVSGGWIGKARVENARVSFPEKAHGGGLTPFNGTDVTFFLTAVQQKIAIWSSAVSK